MKKSIIIALFFVSIFAQSQNVEYARWIIDTLCSPSMHGRGYVNKGDSIAAEFIRNEFKKHDLKSFNNSFKQNYFININTFPYNNNVKVGTKSLIPAVDYFVSSGSKSIKGTYPLVYLDKSIINKKRKFEKFIKEDYSGSLIVIDNSGVKDDEFKKFQRVLKYKNFFKSEGIINLFDSNMIWSVSDGFSVKEHFYIDCRRSCITPKTKTITLDIKNKFIEKYKTQNVIGFVEGKLKPDSFIIFCAHYDHLGRMGKNTYFPGANDNASGTSMVLSLARHFSKPENQPDVSIAFISYSGEEAGLFGSSYFAENPLMPIEKIKFVVNFDMVGTGSTGVKIVNGQKLPKYFDALKNINDEKQYMENVSARGEAANSDHYPLYDKGVPAFFLYTTGPEHKEYHTINDKAEALPLTDFEDLFKLMIDFIKTF